MILNALGKIFGSANERQIKKYRRIVQKINALEPFYEDLSDVELQEQTVALKQRLAKGESLDDIKCEAFATVREASKRVMGQRHYDVQLIGGLVLHDGHVAEMKTGEGKTLVATLPVYLNALSGKGVHLVTVNDYLAKRDAQWMGRIYEFLGLSVGYIIHGLTDDERRTAYAADVTYGTNHEFGFDYLRDNMKFHLEDMVMRDFNYAIVDEVDSILVDEARTPLIISGPAEKSSDLYMVTDQIIKKLLPEHYEKDEKNKNVTFTDAGVEFVDEHLNTLNAMPGKSLYDAQNIQLLHYINASLKAVTMYQKDVDYIVKDNQIIIIDEFTGRMMDGRRYSDGLHQAIEAKEGVEIQIENQTLASITYQNYFRMYPKLSGMSGTVLTEAEEFEEIYKLQCIEIPTNRPVSRLDHDDEFYVTMEEKYKAIVKVIREAQDRGQPVLVGTTSIEKSEELSAFFKNAGVEHSVLNARYHEQEANIIAEAGHMGAVTIATNMAGRGTDIKLGGNAEVRIKKALKNAAPDADVEAIKAKITEEVRFLEEKVKQAGGLFVIGTERHESRRIDNQLRGRSGRQGDPGASFFFLCPQDDLLRVFGFDQKHDYLRKKMKEGEGYSNWMFNKVVASAQRKVEARNFDMRKHLLKYDDVMNDQRKIIYKQRRDFMRADNLSEALFEMRDLTLEHMIQFYMPEDVMQDMWDMNQLELQIHRVFNITVPIKDWLEKEDLSVHIIHQRLSDIVSATFKERYEQADKNMLHFMEKNTLLNLLDQHWKDHLYTLDQLRQGINLRAYAQSNPLNEYKREAFMAFENMMLNLRSEMVSAISHMSTDGSDFKQDQISSMDTDALIAQLTAEINKTKNDIEELKSKAIGGADQKIARNSPCPCGSGKRYKQCCGAI